MTFKVFEDGERLPASDLNEFIGKQLVVQIADQTELTALETYGVRVAITLDTGQMYVYNETGGWRPTESGNLLTIEEADQRYLAILTAQGLYLTQEAAASTYLSSLTAQGLYLTQVAAGNTYLSQEDAANMYLTPTDANSTYLTLIGAGQVYLRQDTASQTYITSVSASQIYLSKTDAANTYLTEIGAGTLFVSKGGAAGDVNSNSTTIDGGKITANSINVNRLVAGTLTGFRVQTSASGRRVLMSESSNAVIFYNDSGSESFRLSGSSGTGGVYDATALHSFQVAGSTVVSINESGMAFAPAAAINSNLNVNGTIVGSSSATLSGGYTNGGTTIGSTGNVYTAGTMRSNADSSTGYAEINSSGAMIRKTVDIGSATFNYAIWDRNSGSLLVGTSTSSDERLKQNISDSSLGLDFINDLRPVEFEFIDPGSPMDEGTQFGLIAQQVNTVLEDHNVSDNNGIVNMPNIEGNQMEYYSVNYEQIIAPLVKAVQELSAKNDELEARLSALEGN